MLKEKNLVKERSPHFSDSLLCFKITFSFFSSPLISLVYFFLIHQNASGTLSSHITLYFVLNFPVSVLLFPRISQKMILYLLCVFTKTPSWSDLPSPYHLKLQPQTIPTELHCFIFSLFLTWYYFTYFMYAVYYYFLSRSISDRNIHMFIAIVNSYFFWS